MPKLKAGHISPTPEVAGAASVRGMKLRVQVQLFWL
jgi:hypothetical protein